MSARITARSAVSVALGIVRAAWDTAVSRTAPLVLPASFDAAEHARWAEMVDSASVVRPGSAQDPSNEHNRAA